MFTILHEGDVFFFGDGVTTNTAGPRLAKLPDGGLVCVFNITSGSGHNDFTPMASYSSDGLSWSDAKPVWPELIGKKSIFVSVRNTDDGRISLAGKAWDIAYEGEFWWDDPTASMKQNRLAFSISEDGKSFPYPTFVDLPFPGAAEEPGGMHVDSDGTIHFVYAPYHVTGETTPSDTNSMVYLTSRDGGKTFDASRFGRTQGECLYAESWIVRLGADALMVGTWQTASKDATNQYFISFDGGKTFTPPAAMPFKGQSLSLNARDDGTVLIAYNQRREQPAGVWLALAKPDENGFNMIENQPAWRAESATKSGGSDDFSGWTDFSFGEPHAVTLDDGTVMLVLWYAKDGQYGIRYIHMAHN